MKKMLLIAFVCSILASCNDTKPPKEIAQEFIKAAYTGDGTTASNLASEKTKANISQAKPQAREMSAEESFSLNNLQESINGNIAEVKNEFIKLSLEKEGDAWKVAATPELVANIDNRHNDLAALKQKWEALLKEYNGRMNVAKEYIQYKKNQGSTNAQIKTAEEMIATLSAKTVWDKEKILMYVQKQKHFQDLIDKALEPSQNANSDMSVNYFLQIVQADDRVKTAETEYDSLAGKTPSATYPVLSEKAMTSMK